MDFISRFEQLKVRDTYDIGFIKRQIADYMKKHEFSDKEIAEVAIVVSELCSNMVKHAVVDGVVRFHQLIEGGRSGIEIIAEDQGPGIENIQEMLKDGVSSKGTLGGGFGAIRRLSDFFEISSNTKKLDRNSLQPGTIVTVRKWRTAPKGTPGANNSDVKVSVLSRPYIGLSLNGDSYYIKSFSDREIIALIDGLGHGIEAHKASNLAIRIIEENTHKSIEEMLQIMNTALKHTRGAVVALFVVYKFINEFEMISIGNIDNRYISGTTTEKLLSNNGFIGAYSGNYKIRKHSYNPGDMLVLCTDGVSPRWDIENYPIEMTKNPSALCSTVFKEYSKQNDDATMIVALL